jgi:hypothetical protein
MIPGIVDFHPEIWPLKLKFQWTDWNPDWKDIMQINDNKPVSSLPTSNTCSMPVLEICQEPKLPNEKETLENIRCLLNEWKEMGKQGWMDSYLPEYWLEGNKEVECSVWFTYYLYEAVQCLDDETFEVITRWIISQAGNENWVNLWKHEWEQNPPDWMIDFPKTEKYFDQITSWVCVVGNV